MELPKISLPSGGGMLDSVKSRLGFGTQEPASSRRSGRVEEEYYEDDYEDAGYDDYDDGYGYDDDYSNGYPDYVGDGGYDDDRYGTVTTRGGSGVSAARLVSIDDVRASTNIPSSLNRDPLPGRRAGASSTSFRTLVNESTPAPNSPADISRRRERSESLDDLFEPTADTTAAAHTGLGSSPLSSANVGTTFNIPTYGAASSANRTLKVIRPLSYGDVEPVAKILRDGDAAVLALEATQADLAKRLLDFSFGVASAMNATVDCLSPKVYFIATGAALTEVERMHLRSQGVL